MRRDGSNGRHKGAGAPADTVGTILCGLLVSLLLPIGGIAYLIMSYSQLPEGGPWGRVSGGAVLMEAVDTVASGVGELMGGEL